MTNSEWAERWDRRSWLIALVGGNLAGLLYVIGTEEQAHIRLHGPGGVSMPGETTPLVMIAATFGQFFLPVLLSGTARRWIFWWGLIPILLYNGWAFADTFISEAANVGTFRWLLLARVPFALLLASGPVSLIRFLVVRGRRLRLAAQEAARRDNASSEGIWPPPPIGPRPD